MIIKSFEAEKIKSLKNNLILLYGANEGHKNIKNAKINDQKLALVIGSEGNGLRSLTKKNLDEIFFIPTFFLIRDSTSTSVLKDFNGIDIFEYLRSGSINLTYKVSFFISNNIDISLKSKLIFLLCPFISDLMTLLNLDVS